MLLSLALVGLLLAAAFIQSTHGTFSAIIMTVLTFCCAAVALGTHEWVAVNWVAPLWKRDYAHALALGATFGVPLVGLRFFFDQTVRRSPLLPLWIDRVFAGGCALLTAFVMVGMVGLTLNMIPFEDPLLGYSRVARVPRPGAKDAAATATPPAADAPDHELLLKPDRFSVTVASMLTDGIFSSSRYFTDVHPDYAEFVGWVNSPAATVSRFVPPKSIAVLRTKVLDNVYKITPGESASRNVAAAPSLYDPVYPKGGHEFLAVRVEFKEAARDERKSFIFSPRQFRLVGRDSEDEPIRQYPGIAVEIDDPLQATNPHVKFTKIRGADWPSMDDTYAPPDNRQAEVVFEVPKSFIPHFVSYKSSAMAAVTEKSKASEGAPAGTPREPSASSSPATGDASGRTGRRRDPTSTTGSGGTNRGLAPREGKSIFGDQMPVTLKAYRKLKNAEIDQQALVGGHLTGNLQEQNEGKDSPVSKFSVPPDKRLLQLNISNLQSRSGLGRSITFAVKTVQNYWVMDDQGRRYEVVGKYVIAQVDGKPFIEVQYFSEPRGSIGGLGEFDKIKDDHLKGDYEFALLFLTDPGAHVVTFSTGGAGEQDLISDNLVAPK